MQKPASPSWPAEPPNSRKSSADPLFLPNDQIYNYYLTELARFCRNWNIIEKILSIYTKGEGQNLVK